MAGSPGDAIEAFGWGPAVAIALSGISTLLALGGTKRPIFTRGELPTFSILRADGYLCWTWVTDKLRASSAEDIDAVLIRPAIGDVSWPEVVDAHTRHPWHRLGSRSPGNGLRYDSCVRLPDDLGPGEPMMLTQTLFYSSAWGSWRVGVHPPNVVSPGRPPP